MKKLVMLVMVIALVAAAPSVFAQMDGVTTTHSAAFGCGACHEAHNTSDTAVMGSSGTDIPLWGSRATAATDLLAYGSGTTRRGLLDSTAHDWNAPAGISLICLGCHDGVTNNGSDTGHEITIAGGASEGYVDTSKSHPISFDYKKVFADLTQGARFKDPAAAPFATSGVQLVDPSAGQDGLVMTLECSSCHEIHLSAVGTAFRGSDASGEALCSGCHAK